MFCKHQWKVLSETVTKSKLEHTMQILRENSVEAEELFGNNANTSRKHIQIITCDKCGKVKRYVENI